ncbi:MAG: DUF447 family protein [Gammaproteobacteria bacterium]|nr:MAG: DUF447 family protein [Gammaproteobacteria bacterium]
MIYEAIITTESPEGETHITPMGYTPREEGLMLAPFLPSTTERNLREGGQAVVNLTDDVRIFSGCLTGRREWPLLPAVCVRPRRLEAALATLEVEVVRIEEDPVRPRFHCRIMHRENLLPFPGFNRAQGAVIEAAILISRLPMLPPEKVDREIEYLTIAVEKTAGERERVAWEWLMQRLREYRNTDATEVDGA